MHIDADDLALVALGEGEPEQESHVQECTLCRSEVESLTRVSRIMVDGGAMPVRPPAHVWAAIDSAIQQDAVQQQATAAIGPRPVGRPVDDAPISITRQRSERSRGAAASAASRGSACSGHPQPGRCWPG